MKHFRNWEGSTALAGLPALAAMTALIAGRAPLNKAASKYVRDKFMTFDQATMDSAGAFFISELERLDPMIHAPLVSVNWAEDIDLRTDVGIGDEYSSYTVSNFGSAGGAQSNGINWASKETTTIPRTVLDIGKITSPLNLVNYEVAYSIPELKSAELTGRPIDTQMIAGMNLKHQMDTDQMVYVGDANVLNSAGLPTTGLTNSSMVTNVQLAAVAGAASPDGATTSTYWTDKTTQEILTDVNALLKSTWAATGYAVPSTNLLLSPTAFAYISTTPVVIGTTGTAETILSFLKSNNLLTAQKNIDLDIQPCKWLDKANSGRSTDRMVAYVQRPEFVRFPMVPLQMVQQQYRGIWINVPYFGRLGCVETVYPETIGYMDGIG